MKGVKALNKTGKEGLFREFRGFLKDLTSPQYETILLYFRINKKF